MLTDGALSTPASTFALLRLACDPRRDVMEASGTDGDAGSRVGAGGVSEVCAGVRMAEWLRPGLWEMLMLSRGIEPGQILASKSPQGRVGTEVTSPSNCGRRKPFFL